MTTGESTTTGGATQAPGAAAEEERYDWREFARTPSAVPLEGDRPVTGAEVGGAVALAWSSGREASTKTEGRMPQRFTAQEMADLVRAFRAHTPDPPKPAPRAPLRAMAEQARRYRAAERAARLPEGGR